MTQQRSISIGKWPIAAMLSAFVWLFETLVIVPILRGSASAGADILTWAIVFDCAVVPALLGYWLVVRPNRRSPLALLPFVAVGLTVATIALPAEHRAPVHALRFLVAPLEFAVVGTALWRMFVGFPRSLARQPGDRSMAGDFESRLRAALPEDGPPAMRLVAAEIIVWYYGLLGRRIPTPAEDDTTFGVAGDTGSLAAALLVIGLFEGVAEHLILWHWSPRADIVLLALSAYGILYIFAERNALRIRPIRLHADSLEVRTGLRWQIDVPYSRICEIRPVLSHARRKPLGYLNAVSFGKPNIRLHLTEPVEARGPFGIRRHARYIALRLDRPQQFRDILARRVPSGTAGSQTGVVRAAASETVLSPSPL